MLMLMLMLVSGFVIGCLSGLMGIGGGAMLVPLFIYAFKFNMYQAVGTALAVIAPVTLVGALSHYSRGHVNLTPVIWVAVSAAIGFFVSGQILHLIPLVVLRRAFALFLLLVAFKMFFK